MTRRTGWLLLLFTWILSVAAQREAPLQVGPFGAIPSRLKPVQAPPDLAALLPRDAVIRLLATTELTPRGETFVVYERGEFAFVTPNVVLVNSGKIIRDFSEDLTDLLEGYYTAGYGEFRLDGRHPAVALAFRNAGDGSQTNYAVLARRGESAEIVFQAQTAQGRLEVLEGRPSQLRLWSAAADLDPSPSCIWCPHRYRLKRFVWRGTKFTLTGEQTTSEALAPNKVNENPVVKSTPKPKT